MEARKEKAPGATGANVTAAAGAFAVYRHQYSTKGMLRQVMLDARAKALTAASRRDYTTAARHLDLYYRLRRQLAAQGGRR